MNEVGVRLARAVRPHQYVHVAQDALRLHEAGGAKVDAPALDVPPALDLSPVTRDVSPRVQLGSIDMADACADWTSPTMADPLDFALPCATESSGADVLERALLQRAQAEAAAKAAAQLAASAIFSRDGATFTAAQAAAADATRIFCEKDAEVEAARRLVDEGHMPVSLDDPPPLEGKSTTEAPAVEPVRQRAPAEVVAHAKQVARLREAEPANSRLAAAMGSGAVKLDAQASGVKIPGVTTPSSHPWLVKGAPAGSESTRDRARDEASNEAKQAAPGAADGSADASAVGFADAPEPTGAEATETPSLGRQVAARWLEDAVAAVDAADAADGCSEPEEEMPGWGRVDTDEDSDVEGEAFKPCLKSFVIREASQHAADPDALRAAASSLVLPTPPPSVRRPRRDGCATLGRQVATKWLADAEAAAAEAEEAESAQAEAAAEAEAAARAEAAAAEAAEVARQKGEEAMGLIKALASPKVERARALEYVAEQRAPEAADFVQRAFDGIENEEDEKTAAAGSFFAVAEGNMFSEAARYEGGVDSGDGMCLKDLSNTAQAQAPATPVAKRTRAARASMIPKPSPVAAGRKRSAAAAAVAPASSASGVARPSTRRRIASAE